MARKMQESYTVYIDYPYAVILEAPHFRLHRPRSTATLVAARTLNSISFETGEEPQFIQLLIHAA